jgi:hypothetical protein
MSKINEKTKQSNRETLPYTQPPTDLMLDHRIDPKAYKVYAALLSFRDLKTLKCFPGIPAIHKRSGISETSVKRSLNDLEKFGWMQRLKRKGEVNNYILYFSLDEMPNGEKPQTYEQSKEIDSRLLNKKREEIKQIDRSGNKTKRSSKKDKVVSISSRKLEKKAAVIEDNKKNSHYRPDIYGDSPEIDMDDPNYGSDDALYAQELADPDSYLNFLMRQDQTPSENN